MSNEKNTNKVDYAFYSKVLKTPFDSLKELTNAEAAYYAEAKEKADKAAQKKTDAKKVEDAFVALNAARKTYKAEIATLTTEYAESLENLKKAFELGKKDIANKLAEAEEAYSKSLKSFTDKYPEGYHITLKDGDFETTISKQTNVADKTKQVTDTKTIADIFNALFNSF